MQVKSISIEAKRETTSREAVTKPKAKLNFHKSSRNLRRELRLYRDVEIKVFNKLAKYFAR